MDNWPESEAIDNTCRNGEVPEIESIDVAGTLYRVNPSGRYALVWTGKKWIESIVITNEIVERFRK